MSAPTRTTTWGVATKWRKLSVASAAISASGSRAINSGASLAATATATSTASVSSLASIADSARSSLSIPPAISASAAAARSAASVLACCWPAAKPLRCACASASARRRSCSTKVMVGSRAAKFSSNRYLAVAFIRVLIDQLFVAAALGDQDFALGGELLGDIDQQRLRLVDVAQPHRAHRLHVIDQHLGGPRRHVGEEELAHRFGSALEGDAELVLVDVAHQRLRRGGVELDQVVEGEHQRLDALGGIVVLEVERGEEAGLGLAVEIVEDLRHDLVRVAAPRLRQIGHEFCAQRLFDALDHFLLHRLHSQHAVDDVERELFRQDREHARGMFGPQLGE